MPPTNEIALVDLSGIVHAAWHMASAEPDPNHTSQQAVAKVRLLTAAHPHAVVCLDVPPYFKREQVPSYKAGRPEHDAALYHQMALAIEQLRADGYPCWGVKGYESDDVMATATLKALALDPEVTVLIFTSDKDMVTLVGPRVRLMSIATGDILDESKAIARYGVTPAQMVDYLALVGDTADNIKGAQGIGPKGAAVLLNRFMTIEALYAALDAGTEASWPELKPAMLKSLAEFQPRVAEVKSLIQLRTDVPIPFEEIAAERKAPELAEPAVDIPPVVAEPKDTKDELHTTMRPSTAAAFEATGTPSTRALAVREPEVLPPSEYERQLDPRSMSDARVLAADMFSSRMFSSYGSAPAVLSTILLGRELGLPAMASLRSIYNIEGKHSLSASLMVALVLKSGLAEFFEPTAISETSVTFETKRKGARGPIALTHTISMAQQAGLVKPGSNWVKDPTSMLIARCQSRLARLVFPDICAGLYSPDELSDMREGRAA